MHSVIINFEIFFRNKSFRIFVDKFLFTAFSVRFRQLFPSGIKRFERGLDAFLFRGELL